MGNFYLRVIRTWASGLLFLCLIWGCQSTTSSELKGIHVGTYLNVSNDSLSATKETWLTIDLDTAYSVVNLKQPECRISMSKGTYTFENGIFCYGEKWELPGKTNECLAYDATWVKVSEAFVSLFGCFQVKNITPTSFEWTIVKKVYPNDGDPIWQKFAMKN